VHASSNPILWTEPKMRKRLFDRKRGTQPAEQALTRKGRQRSSQTVPMEVMGMRFTEVQWDRGCSRKREKQAQRKAEWNSVFQRMGEESLKLSGKGNAQLVLPLWTPFSSSIYNRLFRQRQFLLQKV